MYVPRSCSQSIRTGSSASGTTYWPVSGNAISAQLSQSATVPVIVHGTRRGAEDACPQALVGADPGVKVEAVVSRPAGEVLHGSQRVTALERGPHRRDHALQARCGSSFAKRGQRPPGQPAPPPSRPNGGRHDAQRVGRHRAFVAGYGTRQCLVVAVGEVADGAVPADRHSPATGHDLPAVEYEQVVVREVGIDPAVVLGGNWVVEVPRAGPGSSAGPRRRTAVMTGRSAPSSGRSG